MNFLFIHPNFPGQHKQLIKNLAANTENNVVFICNPKNISIPNVKKIYIEHKPDISKDIHKYLKDLEGFVYKGQAVYRAGLKLKKSGFKPDIIWAHPGWGDALFIKDLFPDVPLITYAEFYYRAFGADMHFENPTKIDENSVAKTRLRNTHLLGALEICDLAHTPTWWQYSTHPKEFQHKISVLHEGIDTELASPNPKATLILPNGKTLGNADKVITYIARNLEPYRGFHKFMLALEKVLKDQADVQVLIIGEVGVSYGRKLPNNQTYKDLMLKKVSLDMDRVHFLNRVPYEQMIEALQISSAHVYLTYPFVLSWSCLEAMSVGAPIIGSDTSPVQEVIQDKQNGRLVDFHDPDSIANAIIEVLNDPKLAKKMSQNARKTIQAQLDASQTTSLFETLFTDLASGISPVKAKTKISKFNPEPKIKEFYWNP